MFNLEMFLFFNFKFPFQQVLDAVRAAEMLVSNMVPKSPGPNRVDMKTTTIVMSKHTLAPQTSTVSGMKPISFFTFLALTLSLCCMPFRFLSVLRLASF